MSRIGNRILKLPEGVELNVANKNFVTIKGPKGTLQQQLTEFIKIENNQGLITTKRDKDLKKFKQLHGTTNSLIKGMIDGVTKGFEKTLIIKGVGYKAVLKGDILNLNLGFSHEVNYNIPKNITIKVPKPLVIVISGINKQLVGQVAAEIRAIKKPEPYKGKGIRYKNEIIIIKEGKSAGK